ncbi:MAG: hypothetical protein MJ237_08915 [bacterium]|nr:hypothetical protein [bacterium]
MTDISNYRFNCPAFTGVTGSTVAPPSLQNSIPQCTLQSDTVSFSASNQLQQPQKESLSTGAKWGLGAIAVVGLGALACALSRGKVGTKQAQQLAEQFEFKPAKTIEEAKKFAKEKLGVTITDEAGKFEDLEMVNFLNQWLTNIHNNPKLGPSAYPKLICNSDKGVASIVEDEFISNGINYGRPLTINTKFFKDFKGRVIDRYMPQLDILARNTEGKYTLAKPEYDSEYTRRLIKYANAEELSFKDKMQCWSDLKAFESRMGEGIEGIQENGIFRTLNHELGHFLHAKSCKDFNLMKNNTGQNMSDITNEFVNNKEIQDTVRKVSKYSTKSPAEFVADTFAGIQDGKTFPDDVMTLYKKYGGPSLS